MTFSTGVRLLKSSITSNTPRALQGGSVHRTFHASSTRAVVYPEANKVTFEKVTSAKDRIAVVDFYADWCGPCHQLAPVLQKLTEEPYKSGTTGLPLDLVKVDTDTDDGQALALEYKVRALPTVVTFREGLPIGQFVGALNEDGVRNFLNKL